MQFIRKIRKDFTEDRQANSIGRIAELENWLVRLEQMLGGKPVNVITGDVENEFAIDNINEIGGSSTVADDVAHWVAENSKRAWTIMQPRYK